MSSASSTTVAVDQPQVDDHHLSDGGCDSDPDVPSGDLAALEAELEKLDLEASSIAEGATDIAQPDDDALQRALRADADEYSHQHPNDARLAAKGHVKDVNIQDVTMMIDGHDLLTLARLRLMHGHRYGLVGRNGIGKSTLLRRIASRQIGGFPAHLKCYLVEQEVAGSEKSVLQVVLDSDVERTRLLALEKKLLKSKTGSSESIELNEVYEKLAAIDSDSAESRACEILDEIGFTKEQQEQPTSLLSGGWRMRVSLACAMFTQPDILLLDEPTNHLDLEAVLWLTQYLQSLDITCVIVSHDARFLSDVTTDTIHFHLQQLKYYPVNFDNFLQTRAEQNANIQRQQENLDAKRAHIRESIEKMKKQARNSGKSEMKLGGVASRQKKLGRMGFEKTADGKKFNAQSHGRRVGCENDSSISTQRKRVAVSQIEPPEPGFKFIFPQPSMEKIPDGVPILSMKDVAFGYDVDEHDMEELRQEARNLNEATRASLAKGEVPTQPATDPNLTARLLFSGLDFIIRPKAKIGVLGMNGYGKSTLLNLISRKLEPTSGEVVMNDHARIGIFSQHFVDQLDLRLTPMQHIIQSCPHLTEQFGGGLNTEQQARSILGRFGLAGKLALTPIGALSGGQKARLVFAVITAREPHLLILDEPSNHLDFVTIQALKDAIETFAGAVILVSHDQALMEVCDELWVVERKKLVKQGKINPNQLKAAALKAQKEIVAANKAAALKAKSSKSASSSSSSTIRSPDEKLTFPSRSTVRKLTTSFEEYRESILNDL